MPRSGGLDRYARVEVATRAEWRAWLEANQARGEGVWLVYRKKAAGGVFGAADAAEEALCFGWIDSLPRKLDAERTMLLVAPRKRGSNWSALNKARAERLIAAGLMRPRGAATIAAAKADGSWSALDAVEALAVPDDLAAAFERHRPARAKWDAFPPSVRRGILEWIVNARSPETRARRVEETAERAAAGERVNQWRARPFQAGSR